MAKKHASRRPPSHCHPGRLRSGPCHLGLAPCPTEQLHVPANVAGARRGVVRREEETLVQFKRESGIDVQSLANASTEAPALPVDVLRWLLK